MDGSYFPKGCTKKKESSTLWKVLYAKSMLIFVSVGEELDPVGERGHACPMRRSVRQVTTLETIESGKDGGGLLMDNCMDGHGAQWNVEFSLPV